MIDAEIHSPIRLTRLIRRLMPSLKHHRVALGASVVLITITTLLDVISPLWIGKAVDSAVNRDSAALMGNCKVFLALICLKAVLDSWLAYLIQTTGQRLMHGLRGELFEHILRLPVGYFDKNPTGRLLTRVMNDIKSLGELFTASLSVLVLDVLVIGSTVVAMLILDWRLGSAILLTFPGVVWVIVHFGELLNQGYQRVRLELSKMNAFLGENIAAIATIQRLGAESARGKKFNSIVDAHEAAQIESLTVYAKVQPFANVLNGVAMATLLGAGGIAVIRGEMTLGTVVVFLGYVRNLFQPIRDLVEKYNNYLSARIAAERIGQILDESAEDSTLGSRWDSGPGMRDGASGEVVFDGVSFTYPGRNEFALSEISFQIAPKTSVAVVGPTGSGKSTLVRLLLRFYEPQMGGIFLYGHPVRDWNLGDLRREIGVVHQDVYLVEGTLRENLLLGTECSDEHLTERVHQSQLWEFIRDRGGLDMRVFEGGTNLSVGERQLVAFTRILVFNPPIVIFDEATASLDRDLEARLMLSVEEILAGRTSIVIAHRLSTIRQCDRVIVLEQGRVIQDGTYEGLSRARGLFREFLSFHEQKGTV